MGLFMAIPLKRQMIQIEPLRFPANIPTGETLKAMYSHGGEAMKKAKALGIAGVLGMLMAGLRDGLEWIPGQVNLGLSIGRINMSKLTLSLEPSLIFIGIGALFGIKVGFSMLLGLILNYGILAPNLIEAKIIHHPAPQVRAVAAPTLPLTVQEGQALTVVLEEATAAPELASGATTNVLRYTWTQPATYATLADLEHDLAAPTLKDGAANPFCHLLSVSNVLSKAVGANVLFLEAPLATNWEAKLSIPAEQPTNLLAALGFKPGAKSLQAIGGFRNISAWSLWPGATVLVVGGLLALAFQWRTLGRTFASIFTGFGNQQEPCPGRTGPPGNSDDVVCDRLSRHRHSWGGAPDLALLDSLVHGPAGGGHDLLPRGSGCPRGRGNRHQPHRRAGQSDPVDLRRDRPRQHLGQPDDRRRHRRRGLQLQRHHRQSQGRPHGRRQPAPPVHRAALRRAGRRVAGRARPISSSCRMPTRWAARSSPRPPRWSGWAWPKCFPRGSAPCRAAR